MAEFRVRSTEELISESELRFRFRNVSLPVVLNKETLDFLGVDVVFASPQPSNSDPLKTVRRYGIIQDSKGNWVENWEVVDLFTGPNKTQDEQVYLTQRAESQWNAVRQSRDQLLRETDWVTIRAQDTGTAVLPAWSTYRQALRDITQQADPFNITWPSKPA